MQGCAWDVWPGDAGAARIATGHAGDVDKAITIAEHFLETDGRAAFCTIVKPDLTVLVCRQPSPGRFVWYPLGKWDGDQPVAVVDTAGTARRA